MNYAMGYISYWSCDYLLAKHCWEEVYSKSRDELKISALVYLSKTLCLLNTPNEAERVLNEYIYSKPKENIEDINYATAYALIFMKKFEEALNIIEKMDDSPQTSALKLFVLLSLDKKSLASSLVKKSTPIQSVKDTAFINYD